MAEFIKVRKVAEMRTFMLQQLAVSAEDPIPLTSRGNNSEVCHGTLPNPVA